MSLSRRSFLRGLTVVSGAGAWTRIGGAAATAAAAVPVTRAGSSRPVSVALFGVNGNNTQRRMRWDRDDFGTALGRLDPGTIRYPGGTIGNYWDWHAGWFQHGGPWPGQTNDLTGEVIVPFDNSLAPFETALADCDASPLWMVNMLTIDGRLGTASDNVRMAGDQVQFLRAAADRGMPVRRVELGNEFYLAGARPGPNENDYAVRFPTAGSYARQANRWVTAIQAAFPSASIAAVGADATGTQSPRREGWNVAVLAELSGADALTLHPYIVLRDATATPQSVLALPHKRVQSLIGGEFAQLNANGMGAWITEFNMVDRTPNLTFSGTWTHALFMAAYALLMAQRGVVKLVDLHNVVGDAVAGVLFDTTEGFRSPTPATTILARSAMGIAYATCIRATQGARTGQALSFPGGPVLAGGAAGLVGMEFSGTNAHQAMIANLAPTAVSLDLSTLFATGYTWTQLTAPSLTTRIAHPSTVATTTGTNGSGTPLTVPAHTLLRLTKP